MTDKVPVDIQAGCAIEDDYIYVAARPAELETEARFSRMFFYDAQAGGRPWVHHDLLDWNVRSVCVFANGPNGREYVALSSEGDVDFRWPGGSRQEKIAAAGLERQTLPVYGYMNAIRQIGDRLFACGGGGQIYMRDNARGWIPVAPNLLVEPPKPGEPLDAFAGRDFTDIVGKSADDFYVVGGNGGVWHIESGRSMLIEVPTDEMFTAAWMDAEERVWICGYNGTVLRGSAGGGFAELSTYDDNMTFDDIAIFGSDAFLASADGLFRYSESAGAIVRLTEGISDTDFMAVDCGPGTVWAFGRQHCYVSDGNGAWRQVRHPDND